MGGEFFNSLPTRVTRFRAWFSDLNPVGKLFVGCWGVSIFFCVLPYLAITSLYSFITIDNSSEVATAPTFTIAPLKNTPTSSTIRTATEVPFSGADYEGGECVPTTIAIEVATVVEIIDGDTILVLLDGEITQLRYIGMDTPEKNQAFGDKALTANRSLVLGKAVYLVKDNSELDSFDRLLRYVFTENKFVNYQLVSLGYAKAASYPPDVSCDLVFLIAEDEAVAGNRGMWRSTATPRPPTPAPTSIPVPTSIPAPTLGISEGSGGGGNDDNGGGESCHPSYPSVCLKPNAGDYDCAGGSGNGPNYVKGPIKVLSPDPFGLDGDSDGIGCE